jgi:hypothetical protein
MVRIEVEILASVDGFSLDFDGQCVSFLMTRTSKEGITSSDSVFHGELNERP